MKLPNQLKRLVFIIVVSFIFHLSSFILVAPVFAQVNPALATNTNPDVPKNLHTWTQNVMIEVMSSLICQLAGVDPVNPNQQCLGVDAKTNKIGFVQNGGGAIAVIGNLIDMTYTPPMHTSDYFGYLAQNFGITKPAYAAQTGTGFDGIKPLIGLWVAFRNIVYMLFVAVFIIIGFGIMLRINIDPRTVMAISNQLPKIIVTILLVTFSFAIAGFLIDIMWVSMHVTYNVIAGAKVQNADVTDLSPANIAGESAFGAIGGTLGIGGKTWGLAGLASTTAWNGTATMQSMLGITSGFLGFKFDDVFNGSFPYIHPSNIKFSGMGPLDVIIDLFSFSVAYFGSTSIASAISLPIAGLIPSAIFGAFVFGGVSQGLRAFLPFLIIFVIVITALMWALFRVWFALIKAYVYILINVILAPFWIVAGLIPGSSINFSGWMREMLGNLSVFPVTYGMLLLGRVFFDTFSHPVAGQQPFTPPFIGNLGDTNFLAAIIGVGIILLTPQVVEMMHGLFKVEGFKYGAGVGQAIGVGTGVTNVPSHAGTIGNMTFTASHIPWVKDLGWVKKMTGGPQTPGPGGHP